MDKETVQAIREFERLGVLALKLKDAANDIERREAELAGAEKRKKAADDAADSANAQVAAKQAELSGLEKSIMVIQQRLAEDKQKAREDFDTFVAGIKAEERAIDTAKKKKQAEFDSFVAKLANDQKQRQDSFEKMVASHEKWKKDHGLA